METGLSGNCVVAASLWVIKLLASRPSHARHILSRRGVQVGALGSQNLTQISFFSKRARAAENPPGAFLLRQSQVLPLRSVFPVLEIFLKRCQSRMSRKSPSPKSPSPTQEGKKSVLPFVIIGVVLAAVIIAVILMSQRASQDDTPAQAGNSNVPATPAGPRQVAPGASNPYTRGSASAPV